LLTSVTRKTGFRKSLAVNTTLRICLKGNKMFPECEEVDLNFKHVMRKVKVKGTKVKAMKIKSTEQSCSADSWQQKNQSARRQFMM